MRKYALSNVFIFSFLFLNIISIHSVFAKTEPIIDKRVIKFVNECPFPVWFGFISGATPSRTGAECQSDVDCFSGSVCVDRGAASNHCFWKNPVPANNQYQLAARGGTNSVDIPFYDDELKSVWSGAAAARTNCTSAGCETADCGAGTGGCPPGRGFGSPTTLAEFTFNKTGSDFYDISLVNGMNIPVEMGPTLSSSERLSLCKAEGCGDPYNCGSPGASMPITKVGRCSWDMMPPSIDYRKVAVGGPSCQSDSDCGSPLVCGLSYDAKKSPKLQKTCGRLIGYYTANEVCGKDRTMGAPFNCMQSLPAPDGNLFMYNLYGCSPVGSCYQKDAKSNCCGCVNWDLLGIDVPPAPYTQQCTNKNAFWITNVQPKLEWIKRACPTVYTYPYDDMSSTFVCKVLRDGRNVVNYTITFCPDGETSGTNPLANKMTLI